MRTSASLPEHGDGITLADLARAGWGGGAPQARPPIFYMAAYENGKILDPIPSSFFQFLDPPLNCHQRPTRDPSAPVITWGPSIWYVRNFTCYLDRPGLIGLSMKGYLGLT